MYHEMKLPLCYAQMEGLHSGILMHQDLTGAPVKPWYFSTKPAPVHVKLVIPSPALVF